MERVHQILQKFGVRYRISYGDTVVLEGRVSSEVFDELFSVGPDIKMYCTKKGEVEIGPRIR